jgi:hypothetical protein
VIGEITITEAERAIKKDRFIRRSNGLFYYLFKEGKKLATLYSFAFTGFYFNFVASFQIGGAVAGHGHFVALNAVNGTFNFSSQRYGCGGCDKSHGQCQSQKFLAHFFLLLIYSDLKNYSTSSCPNQYTPPLEDVNPKMNQHSIAVPANFLPPFSLSDQAITAEVF